MTEKDARIKVIMEQEEEITKALKKLDRERSKLQKKHLGLVNKRTILAARKLVGERVVLKGNLHDESLWQLWRATGRMIKTCKGNRCIVDFAQHGPLEVHLLDVMAEDRHHWQRLIYGD